MRAPLRLETALPVIAALVAAGCRNKPPPLRTGEVQVCQGKTPALLAGLTLAPAKGHADYLELREEALRGQDTPPEARLVTLAKSGVPCASATDKPRCEAALGAVRSKTGFSTRSSGSQMAPSTFVTYLIANFGDEIEVIANDEQLRGLLAPFDTTSDVELLAGCGAMLKVGAQWEVTRSFKDDGSCFGGTSGWTRLTVSESGMLSIKEDHAEHRAPTCISGRRPDGLAPARADEACGDVAAFFAESARLEAASVVAFERLADELSSLGAPADLVARALRSRDDEIRHARTMEALASDAGAVPRPVAVEAPRARSPFAIARENAVEGCVRETFGALVAHYQAHAAESAHIREAMRVIAADETSHASLAWDVAAWLEPRLTEDERRQLVVARTEALDELHVGLRAEPSPSLVAAGLPGARASERLLTALATLVA